MNVIFECRKERRISLVEFTAVIINAKFNINIHLHNPSNTINFATTYYIH